MSELDRLVYAARDSNPGALGVFIATSYDVVWRLCAALVDRQSADDLAQETYCRCIRALPRFRGDSSARTWLLSIARHVCADEIRLRSRLRGAGMGDAGIIEDPAAPDIAESVAISDLLTRLGPDRREAFVLTQMIRLGYAEAAAVCGCPVGTIRSRVARARDDLILMLREAERAELSGTA